MSSGLSENTLPDWGVWDCAHSIAFYVIFEIRNPQISQMYYRRARAKYKKNIWKSNKCILTMTASGIYVSTPFPNLSQMSDIDLKIRIHCVIWEVLTDLVHDFN